MIIDPDLTLYVNSYNRPNKQITLDNLPAEIAKNVNLVVRSSELKSYEKYMPKIETLWAIDDHKIDSLAKTRQWTFDHCRTRYLMFLDDDLRFYHRANPEDWHLTYMKELEDYTKMFQEMVHKARLEGAAHLSVSPREGNNRHPSGWNLNRRYMRLYMYDKQILLKEKIEISRCTMMMDFDVALQLIRKGYPAYVDFTHAQGHPESNSAGGCSNERNRDDRDGSRESNLLRSFHPDYVKVRSKTTLKAWGGGQRWDVTVSWNKAFKSSQVPCGGCGDMKSPRESCCEPISARQLHPE